MRTTSNPDGIVVFELTMQCGIFHQEIEIGLPNIAQIESQLTLVELEMDDIVTYAGKEFQYADQVLHSLVDSNITAKYLLEALGQNTMTSIILKMNPLLYSFEYASTLARMVSDVGNINQFPVVNTNNFKDLMDYYSNQPILHSQKSIPHLEEEKNNDASIPKEEEIIKVNESLKQSINKLNVQTSSRTYTLARKEEPKSVYNTLKNESVPKKIGEQRAYSKSKEVLFPENNNTSTIGRETDISLLKSSIAREQKLNELQIENQKLINHTKNCIWYDNQ